jgi:hypothetical protein
MNPEQVQQGQVEGGQNLEMEKLIEFKDEMQRMKAEEVSKGETAHFEAINPEELTIEDMHMWQVFKDFKDGDDLDKLVSILTAFKLSVSSVKPVNLSRVAFGAFISNKVGYLTMIKGMENF